MLPLEALFHNQCGEATYCTTAVAERSRVSDMWAQPRLRRAGVEQWSFVFFLAVRGLNNQWDNTQFDYYYYFLNTAEILLENVTVYWQELKTVNSFLKQVDRKLISLLTFSFSQFDVVVSWSLCFVQNKTLKSSPWALGTCFYAFLRFHRQNKCIYGINNQQISAAGMWFSLTSCLFCSSDPLPLPLSVNTLARLLSFFKAAVFASFFSSRFFKPWQVQSSMTRGRGLPDWILLLLF